MVTAAAQDAPELTSPTNFVEPTPGALYELFVVGVEVGRSRRAVDDDPAGKEVLAVRVHLAGASRTSALTYADFSHPTIVDQLPALANMHEGRPFRVRLRRHGSGRSTRYDVDNLGPA